MQEKLEKQDVKIYFLSPFPNPKIHLTYDTQNGKEWVTIPMKKSKKQRDLYVYRPHQFQKLMFVFCSQEKKDWYHPDQQNQKPKYLLRNCEKDQSKGNMHFFLNQKTFSESKKHLNFARFLVFDGVTISIKKHVLDKKLCIVTDLDDTLVCHYNNQPQQKFKKFYLKHFVLQNTVKLIYNTGRSLKFWYQLKEKENLLMPDYLILESGTRIFDCSQFENEEERTGKVVNKQFVDRIMENYDATVVKQVVEEYLPWVAKHPFEMNNDTRVAYVPLSKEVHSNMHEIEEAFSILKNQHNINAKYIISGEGSNLFMDIVSVNADKGNATIFCIKELLGMDIKDSVSFGDSKNDCQMLRVTGKSFLVKNAQESLKKWLKEADEKNHNHISISSMEFSYAIICYLKEYFNL